MRGIQEVTMLSVDQGEVRNVHDEVVVEEPLEIRVNNVSFVVTMRTPGDDFDLAIGLLWSEGVIRSAADIGTIAYCPDEEQPELKNRVNITLTDSSRLIHSSRSVWTNSSCGICGKSTIESIRRDAEPVHSSLRVHFDVLLELPQRLRAEQEIFGRTGGIHAAGLFDQAGNLRLIREDLGRHNAVDKVLGAALQQGLSPSGTILMVSGRLGFEIAQKAVVAGIPIVASVSAPSSLALELAHEFGITAVGFVRNGSLNIYSHPQRILYALSKHSS